MLGDFKADKKAVPSFLPSLGGQFADSTGHGAVVQKENGMACIVMGCLRRKPTLSDK